VSPAAELEQEREAMEKDEIDLGMPGYNYIVRRAWARTREESQVRSRQVTTTSRGRRTTFCGLA
jgi:hypothetical protein